MIAFSVNEAVDLRNWAVRIALNQEREVAALYFDRLANGLFADTPA